MVLCCNRSASWSRANPLWIAAYAALRLEHIDGLNSSWSKQMQSAWGMLSGVVSLGDVCQCFLDARRSTLDARWALTECFQFRQDGPGSRPVFASGVLANSGLAASDVYCRYFQ